MVLPVTPPRLLSFKAQGARGGGGAGGWHKASVLGCLPLAAPIGLSPLLIRTLCGPERVLVVSTEPPDDLPCLTTPGVGRPGDGLLPVPLTSPPPPPPVGGGRVRIQGPGPAAPLPPVAHARAHTPEHSPDTQSAPSWDGPVAPHGPRHGPRVHTAGAMGPRQTVSARPPASRLTRVGGGGGGTASAPDLISDVLGGQTLPRGVREGPSHAPAEAPARQPPATYPWRCSARC